MVLDFRGIIDSMRRVEHFRRLSDDELAGIVYAGEIWSWSNDAEPGGPGQTSSGGASPGQGGPGWHGSRLRSESPAS